MKNMTLNYDREKETEHEDPIITFWMNVEFFNSLTKIVISLG